MKERLEAIKKAALEKIEQADAMDSLNDIRVSVPVSYTHLDVYKRQVLHWLWKKIKQMVHL